MNTYLIPIFDFDSEYPYIQKIVAKSYSDAKEKVMDFVCNKYDLDYPTDWEEFISDIIPNSNITVGKLSEIEEF